MSILIKIKFNLMVNVEDAQPLLIRKLNVMIAKKKFV